MSEPAAEAVCEMGSIAMDPKTVAEEPQTYVSSTVVSATESRQAGKHHRNRRAVARLSSCGSSASDTDRSSLSLNAKEGHESQHVTYQPTRRSSSFSSIWRFMSHNTAPPKHECTVFEEKDEGREQGHGPGPGQGHEDTHAQEDVQQTETGCVPITPAHLMNKKYRRCYCIPQAYTNGVPEVAAMKTRFQSLTEIQSESQCHGLRWQTCESPEGNVYFREEKHNIVTLVDLFNDSYCEGVSSCARELLNRKTKQESMPEDAELVVVLSDYHDGLGYGYGYYLASWEERCVFWFENTGYNLVMKDSDRICLTESHIGKRIEYLFWVHAELFPCHRTPPCGVIRQLMKIINLGFYDHITSDNSIFPYDKSEAADMLKCLERVESSYDAKSPAEAGELTRADPNDIWIVARCKQNLEDYRFINHHGERGARVHRYDSLHKETIYGDRSLFFQIISPMLFFMPSVYMKEIEGVWIDETVDWISWRRFISILGKDWEQSMTPATVILSANVGFLAIGSIDNNGAEDRSAAQIISYLSSVLSFFFFITVQVLTHQHRSSPHYTASRACAFLERRSTQWLGLESVAITYSLPTALFIWSMLTFLAALMVVFFWHTSLATRIVLGIAVTTLLLVTTILLWLDWNNHSGSHGPYEPPTPERSIIYKIIPPGLRNFVLGIPERWQAREFFRLNGHKLVLSTLNPSSTTMVGSTGDSSK